MDKVGKKKLKIGERERKVMEMLYSRGFTDKEVAYILGIGERTLSRYIKEDDRLRELREDWKVRADKAIESSLYERAKGIRYEEEKAFVYRGEIIKVKLKKWYPPDPTSMIFWLKNRKPEEWQDKKNMEIGEDSLAVIFGKANEKRENGKGEGGIEKIEVVS